MIAPLLLVAAATFSPPLNAPYRLVIHQERVQGGVTRRYEIERRLVFHRDRDAWVVEMTLLRVWQDAGGPAGQRFEAAAGALKGRTVRLHLAADGMVRSIDDEAALWGTVVAGIAAAASPDRSAASAAANALVRDPATGLAALPIERRRAMLATPFTSLLVGYDETLAAGTGPIVLPSGVVPGGSLAGTRSVAIADDAHVHIAIHAAGADPVHPVSLDREQVVDPASGLVLDERQSQVTGAGDAAQIMRQHVSLEPMVR